MTDLFTGKSLVGVPAAPHFPHLSHPNLLLNHPLVPSTYLIHRGTQKECILCLSHLCNLPTQGLPLLSDVLTGSSLIS